MTIPGRIAPSNDRFSELDALRGLAALSVAVSHHLNVLPTEGSASSYRTAGRLVQTLHYTPLYVIFGGHEAVVLFFVLSGFVLILPWLKGRPVPTLPFLVRRWARIYVPYIVAVAVGIAFDALLYRGPIPELSIWFNDPWSKPLGRALIIGHVLLVGTFDQAQIAPVFWTLTIEMRMSILFPLLAFFAMRFEWRTVLLSALGMAFTAIILRARSHNTEFIALVSTFHYAGLFVVGALLAKHLKGVLAAWRRLAPLTRAAALLAALLLYVYGRAAAHVAEMLGDWPIAVGVVVFFVAALAEERASGNLRSRWAQFLGRISYSLYLFHTIVLLGLVHLLYGHVPLALILVVSFGLCVIVAWASHRYVELPSIRWGRALARRLDRQPSAAVVMRQ
jgi:peptidoglycan/LPS O-acetylase OafA/YrhL